MSSNQEQFLSLLCCEGFCYNLNKINLDKNLIIDSIPIVMAGSSRSRRTKVAPDIANKDFCASKKYIINAQNHMYWSHLKILIIIFLIFICIRRFTREVH
jgi:hypothetical protein